MPWRLRHGDPYEIRTRVAAVKGRCLNHLTNGPHLINLKAIIERYNLLLYMKNIQVFAFHIRKEIFLMQEIQETLFEGITQEEIDNFFGKPEYKYEKIEMTKEEEKAFVEDFIKRVTVKTTSLNSISSINTTSTIQHNCIEQCPFNPSNPISKKETDPFEGSEIDMTEEEAEEFIKNFKMDFDTSKTKEKFSKSKPKVFKPKSKIGRAHV